MSTVINAVEALCCFVIFVKLNEFVAVLAAMVNFEAYVVNQFHFLDVKLIAGLRSEFLKSQCYSLWT